MFVTSWCIICAGCVVVVVATRQPLTSCLARPPCPPPLFIPRQCRRCLMSLSLGASFSPRYCTHNLTPTLSSNCRLPFGVLDRDVVTAGRSGHGSQGRGTVAGHFSSASYCPPCSLKICSSECLRQINFKICRGEEGRRHIACLHSSAWQMQPPSVRARLFAVAFFIFRYFVALWVGSGRGEPLAI